MGLGSLENQERERIIEENSKSETLSMTSQSTNVKQFPLIINMQGNKNSANYDCACSKPNGSCPQKQQCGHFALR